MRWQEVNMANQLLKRRGKYAFIASLPPGTRVLDVGCGNDSPFRFKRQRPDCRYIGIDIDDYRHTVHPEAWADTYIRTDSQHFVAEIQQFFGQLDAVISSHNLEHCDAPAEVLDAMVASLRPGGRLYLAFPTEASMRFPHRRGGLNFCDDSTHKSVPDWRNTMRRLTQLGVQIDFSTQRYHPLLLTAIGFLLEPYCALLRRNGIAGSTWALYGFESVIWASRVSTDMPTSGHEGE